MKKILVLFILTSFMSVSSFAQLKKETVEIFELTSNKPFLFNATSTTVNVPGTGSGTDVTTFNNTFYRVDCSASTFFSDRAGKHKPYENNRDYYTTICPNSSSQGITIDFQQFALEKFDTLYVFNDSRTGPVADGSGVPSSRLIGKFTRRTSPGRLVSTRGCLTFRFVTDGSVNDTGFFGKIGCQARPVADPCVVFNSRVDSDLMCGMTITDDNFRGRNNYQTYSCGGMAMGRELIYRFNHTSAGDLTFRLKELNGNSIKQLNLYVLNNCTPSACVGSVTRPAANGSQSVETVTIPNAAAGTYYVVVDGNMTYARNRFQLTVECGGGSAATCSNPAYYEDFESFDVGSGITKVSNHWFKSNNVGLRDAEVSSARASNGTKSLEFNRRTQGTQDVFLHLGREFRGKYRIAFDMYIAPMSTAFFGLFGGDNSDPWGSVSKEFGMNNGMEGRWFNIELFVDLDQNRYVLYMDNRKQQTSGTYFLNLDALNFYGLPGAQFYIDNLCYSSVGSIPAASSRVMADAGTPLYDADKQLQAAGNVNSNDISSTLGLSASKLNADDLRVMPNPTTGITFVALDLAQEQAVNLQVFSSAGQLVRELALGKINSIRQEINLNDLSNGLYILKVTGEQSVITKKIVLQK